MALALAGALGLPPAVAAPVVDLLDLPARASPRSATALQVGVALAGKRLVSVGERGFVRVSDDGGKTWAQADVPVAVTLTAVQFVDARHGWAVGHDGVVLSSDDAGSHWVRRFDGTQANAMVGAAASARVAAARAELAAARDADSRERAGKAVEQSEFALDDAKAAAAFGPSRPLLALGFETPAAGWVVGSYGQIFSTTDGGRQWRFEGTRMPNPEGLHLNSLSVVGDTLLIAAEAGQVFRSDDRGATWRRLDTGGKGALYGVIDLGGPAARSLLAFGFAGRVYRTDDGGERWSAAGESKHVPTLVAGQRLPSSEVLMLGQDASLWRSAAQGRSLRAVGRAGLPRAAAFVVVPGARAVVVGLGGAAVVNLDDRP